MWKTFGYISVAVIVCVCASALSHLVSNQNQERTDKTPFLFTIVTENRLKKFR